MRWNIDNAEARLEASSTRTRVCSRAMNWLRTAGWGSGLIWALCAAACHSGPGEPTANPPATSPRVEIHAVSEMGPYAAADVRGVAGTMRFYFAPGGSCRELIQEGAAALYLPEGRFGSLAARADGRRCEPVGVADLAAWRDRLPLRRSRFLQPREIARFRPAGSANRVILVRGSFPLALELRIPNPGDLVAVLPDEPACRSLLAARSGMLEYQSEGPTPLVLRGADGACALLGLAIPLALN